MSETRRSGRATKGQHRGYDHIVSMPTPGVSAKKNKTAPADEETEASIIRCVCGQVEEDSEDERKMICCEECEAWQHNECMQVSQNDDELPEEYFCEQCRPQDHQALLDQNANGRQLLSRPHHAPPRADERLAAEQLSEMMYRAKADRSRQLGGEKAARDFSENISSKRKADEGAATKEPKMRKGSNPTPRRKSGQTSGTGSPDANGGVDGTSLQTELVSSIEELQSVDRRRVASALSKTLESQMAQAQQEGSFSLSDGQTVADFALALALNVEYAIYLNFFGSAAKPSELYGDKFRMIWNNIKINASLRDRLLSGALSPNDLSKMSREDMASKELQAKKAEMLKRAEKQHVLIHEEGPRIRRTHKGDEVIGQDTHGLALADVPYTAPIRQRADTDADPENDSAQSPGPIVEVFHAEAASPTTPADVETDRRSATTFNIDQVWSGVRGPSSDRQTSRPSQTPAVQAADPDIDSLLRDDNNDNEDDEVEYEPMEYGLDTDPPIWRGRLTMPGIANFAGQAIHAAGKDISFLIPWDELLAADLGVQGRIEQMRADEYLCGITYSESTELVVVAITPSNNGEDEQQFDKLFDYFIERKRYGVLSKHANEAVKDAYIVPLEKGASQKPEFVALLDHCSLALPCPQRTLLVGFVIRTSV